MVIRELGIKPYEAVWDDMKRFTTSRNHDTVDEIWLLEHFPVYTQGQAGKIEHILNPKDIPIIQTDRGGQVTYHGPGQLIAYVLIDLSRRHLGVRTLVCHLEQVLIDTLQSYDINASRRQGAPGVYVAEQKIASIGLRVKNGCTYHGIALNVALDLSPFSGINPCGYKALQMTQIRDFYPDATISDTKKRLTHQFIKMFQLKEVNTKIC